MFGLQYASKRTQVVLGRDRLEWWTSGCIRATQQGGPSPLKRYRQVRPHSITFMPVLWENPSRSVTKC